MLIGGPALASAEAPQKIPVQAYLTDAEDVPIDDEASLEVKIYNAPTEGGMHAEQFQVQANSGSLAAYLGTNEPVELSLFRDHEELYLGIAINGGEELAPRIRLAMDPYAGFAEHVGRSRQCSATRR